VLTLSGAKNGPAATVFTRAVVDVAGTLADAAARIGATAGGAAAAAVEAAAPEFEPHIA
jgi:hypothetical protein